MKNLTLEQATRFYNTLAYIIGKREGVKVTVTVTAKEERKAANQ